MSPWYLSGKRAHDLLGTGEGTEGSEIKFGTVTTPFSVNGTEGTDVALLENF